MRKIKKILVMLMFSVALAACQDIIDVDPISNVGVNSFYRSYDEVNTALTGCYNGLHQPLTTEWMMTELRSDNAKQGVPNSTSTANIELNQLDLYSLNSTHPKVYDYWLSVYKNIRSLNYVLHSLGVEYQGGEIRNGQGTAKMSAAQRDQLAGEALFLRAYHYFNLVRLYGGVFLVTEPTNPEKNKLMQRSTVAECYDLILADLRAAETLLPVVPHTAGNAANLGHATVWAAKALLAKVYLTLDRKAEALVLLNEITANSGHGLQSTYAAVFAVSQEMNKEILFAVRYKAGGFGLGNPMANTFAPTGSGSAVINGDGLGHNFPTTQLSAAYKTPAAGTVDSRKDVTMGIFSSRLYVKKFLSPVTVRFDAENDFPVIRYADVLLMKAEAIGFDGPSGNAVGLINEVRVRAGAQLYSSEDFNTGFYTYPVDADDPNAITSTEAFRTALFTERRLELAFENHRFFDLLRAGNTLGVVSDYYTSEYDSHYSRIRPVITLAEMQGTLVEDRLLLPIPQRELDTNDQLTINQNPGY